MLKTLKLVNYRAFRRFTLHFRDTAYLVGPNNAGKSTILTSLRLSEALLRLAYARKSEFNRADGESWFRAYPVSLSDFPALNESIRHEFRTKEARLELTWKSNAKLTVIWPEGDELEGFFYLKLPTGQQPQTTAQVRSAFSEIGIVPLITPLEHTESLLTETYVRRNMAGRLSSRHFRNQLYLLQQDDLLKEFLKFATPWLPEIDITEISKRQSSEGMVLDLYYTEAQNHILKEIVWAGDGFHVWLQVLLHVFRLRDKATIVLDEPDVYLHSDLQIRLVRLLKSTRKQVILATHSSEIIAEADRAEVVIIDKSLGSGLRAKNDAVLEAVSDAVGSQFNLRIARALKSRVALFVEGDDIALLSRVAEKIGADHIAFERGIAVIPLTGYSHWPQVEPFGWLIKNFLGGAVKSYVILDRDYRPDSLTSLVVTKLNSQDISAHVWRRKELESYLLNPEVIARISGASEVVINEMLDEAFDAQETHVFSQMLDERIRFEVSGKQHVATIAARFKKEFDQDWKERDFRLARSPAKSVLSSLNADLSAKGFKTVSARVLANAHRANEFPNELTSVLFSVEQMVI